MADRMRYPQIPSTVWWGFRSILKKNPGLTIDEKLLGAQLDVQEAAAKAYVFELKAVGLLTEEGKATLLAQKWRLDDTYPEAIEELLSSNYPEPLLHLAPASEGDRQKITNWFLREGFGQGAAGNKAATYLLIGSSNPNEAPTRNSKSSKENEALKASSRSRVGASKAKETSTGSIADAGREGVVSGPPRKGPLEMLPLNINVQIHISADAGSEQIESIFSAMRRYLYDAQNN